MQLLCSVCIDWTHFCRCPFCLCKSPFSFPPPPEKKSLLKSLSRLHECLPLLAPGNTAPPSSVANSAASFLSPMNALSGCHLCSFFPLCSYHYSFPFLRSFSPGLSISNNRVGPLYKHVFPPQLAPGLSLLGLPWKVCTLPQSLSVRWYSDCVIVGWVQQPHCQSPTTTWSTCASTSCPLNLLPGPF